MQWLNIEVGISRTPEWVTATPTQRATWLALMLYSAEKENYGIISGCKKWSDRMWLQLCAVSLKEVRAECELWNWDDEDIILQFYPCTIEENLQAKRKAGRMGGSATSLEKQRAARENGKKGGRKRTQAETQVEDEENQIIDQSEFELNPSENQTKGKVKKGKEKESGGLGYELPFESEKFAETWEAWNRFRKEKRQPLTPTTIQAQLKKLGAMGEANAVASLVQSMENGWTGLFEPRSPARPMAASGRPLQVIPLPNAYTNHPEPGCDWRNEVARIAPEEWDPIPASAVWKELTKESQETILKILAEKKGGEG